jgi:hypothetical protein
MFGDKKIDQADCLALPLLFLALGYDGMYPVVNQSYLSKGSLEIGKDELILSEIDPQA